LLAGQVMVEDGAALVEVADVVAGAGAGARDRVEDEAELERAPQTLVL
jgi:hypothetical protein